MAYRAIGFDYNGVISDGYSIDNRILDLVDSLKTSGYKMGLLSNYGHSGAERIRQSGIAGHFDVFHVSGETGFAKPQPEAFKNLAEELVVNIIELVFIDDSEYCLSTAKSTGFTPVLYKDFASLINALSALGIKH